MEKKAYIAPESTALAVKLQQMIAYSGGGSSAGDPIVSSEGDDSESEITNMTRPLIGWGDGDF